MIRTVVAETEHFTITTHSWSIADALSPSEIAPQLNPSERDEDTLNDILLFHGRKRYLNVISGKIYCQECRERISCHKILLVKSFRTRQEMVGGKVPPPGASVRERANHRLGSQYLGSRRSKYSSTLLVDYPQKLARYEIT